MSTGKAFEELVEIMARLRSPDGCPWDRKQDTETLTPYLLEEAYELLAALRRNDLKESCEEMGDLLLQVVFHARIFEERGAFAIKDVVEGISQKLIRRHPHVFGEESIDTAEKVVRRWEQIKADEKNGAGHTKAKTGGPTHSDGEPERAPRSLSGVPLSLPALLRAFRLSAKASRVGLDWTGPSPVLEKVNEETAELKAAVENEGRSRVKDELGDLLFGLVSLARHLDLDPEEALHQACEKFTKRVKIMEDEASQAGTRLEEMDAGQIDDLWNRSKTGLDGK